MHEVLWGSSLLPSATSLRVPPPTPAPAARSNVSMEEQRRVLMKRRGSVVGRRSILKSYALPPPPGGAAAAGAGPGAGQPGGGGGAGAGSPLAVEGVSDIRWGPGWAGLGCCAVLSRRARCGGLGSTHPAHHRQARGGPGGVGAALCDSPLPRPRLPPRCAAAARHVAGLPVAALGDASVDGLRRLLGAAGAKPGGPRHIVVTDLREELVL